MGTTNSTIVAQAGQMDSPLTFTATAGNWTQATDNVQALMDLIATEGADMGTARLFLDQMTPAARTSLYATLTALKASLTSV